MCIYISVSVYVYKLICLNIYIRKHISANLSLQVPNLSIYLSIYLSFYLSILQLRLSHPGKSAAGQGNKPREMDDSKRRTKAAEGGDSEAEAHGDGLKIGCKTGPYILVEQYDIGPFLDYPGFGNSKSRAAFV